MATRIYSIGHSNLSLERFMELLRNVGVGAIADVRSAPFSRRAPWFSQSEFKAGLSNNGLAYSFLGSELGGRPKEQHLFRGGVADYSAMARLPSFQIGLDRLLHGSEKYSIAMVCSERDPLHCHRCLLIGRQLAVKGAETCHIHSNGSEETQREAEERLLREENLSADDLLWPRDERLHEAYLRRNLQVAYALSSAEAKGGYAR
jgi:uncharacterized protein (DUF488 family)